MNDEELKAIESFKKENNNDLSRFDDFNSYTQFKVKRDKIIINLIENQQKEIEELKETNEDNAEKSLLNDIFIKKNYISKDKIREKIKEYQYKKADIVGMLSNYERWKAKIEILQELLEEN